VVHYRLTKKISKIEIALAIINTKATQDHISDLALKALDTALSDSPHEDFGACMPP